MKRNPDIDVGLAALVKHVEPGETLKPIDIAEVCNTSRSYINYLERSALKKIRARCMADLSIPVSKSHALSDNYVPNLGLT